MGCENQPIINNKKSTEMKEFIFTIGLPGSGKTTFLKERGYCYAEKISADDIKDKIRGASPADKDESKIHEESVQEARNEAFRMMSEGYNRIVMDMGGINSTYTKTIIANADLKGYKTKAYFLDTPVDVCIERMKQRGRIIPLEDVYKKNCKLNACLIDIADMGVEIEVVPYFTNKYLFLDMDGTICSYQKPPRDMDGNVDFVNSQMFKNATPVKHVIEWAEKWGYEKTFILGACPNSIAMGEKMFWIQKNIDKIYMNNVYFVGNKDYKHVFLKHLIQKLKLNKRDVLVVDDNYDIIDKMLKLGVNCIHPSNIDSIKVQEK